MWSRYRIISFTLLLATANGLTVHGQVALVRQPNTTLKMPLEPPVYGYTLTNAFGTLTFTNPTAVAVPPGETNRLFVLERAGRVIVITNLANPSRTVFLDISEYVAPDYLITEEEGLLGIAFHPGYATNRYFFLTFGLFTDSTQGSGRHERLARFETSATNDNWAPASSELPLITQLDQNVIHSYNDLQFGPDGYLYVAVGDEGGYNDEHNNSQRIDKNLFSGILRLDVDLRPDSLPPNPHPAVTDHYAIPPDNPFVGATNFNGSPVEPTKVRTEFYAVGLRNPYRMFFDKPTGRLYCGDVGEAAREEINLIVRGGNYGWAFFEGNGMSMKEDMPAPPPDFVWIAPIWEYFHGPGPDEGNSAIGGVVYHGDRLSQLTGSYLFGDYDYGNIWALRYDGTNSTVQRLINDPGVAAFGSDPRNGDVLIVNHNQGIIKRLNYSSHFTGTPIPTNLLGTGAFSNLTTLTPHRGIVPYDVNVSFWSDNAQKTRWFSLPATNLTLNFSPSEPWGLPPGAVWIKHFELARTNGVPSSAQRVETRFLVRNAEGVYGVTYRWGDSLTNALLVGPEGMDEEFVIHDGDLVRTQVWHYPSRNECRACHSDVAGGALGFNTAQLNRNFTYAGVVDNQIHALSRAGYFHSSVTNLHLLPSLAPATDGAWSLEYRVRSYLAANCAQCHQPGGIGGGVWDARITTPLAAAGIVHGLLQSDLGDPDNRVIEPGSLEHSVILRRISTLGPERMPPLASHMTNSAAISLLSEWITTELTQYQTFPEWQLSHFGSTEAPEAAPEADPDEDGASNDLEYLTGTDPKQASEAWKISVRKTDDAIQIIIPQVANRGIELQTSGDLFDWSVADWPGNQPFFSVTNRLLLFEDRLSNNAAGYYRVRVFQP